VKISVIMPVERIGGDAERAIESIRGQEAPFPFELIVVSAQALPLPHDERVRNVVEPNRNPATRRNRAVSVARGEILAFIDDDAVAGPLWLATACQFLDSHPEVLALGGPDPAPSDSSTAELIADTLLSTPWIGSGVAAHEGRKGIFVVRAPNDVALVNLFVRRSAFNGFDESVGYIAEDTAMLEPLVDKKAVVYHDAVRVYHRRRAFPRAYLHQRWRYRLKTGEMIVRGSRAHRGNAKVQVFLIAGTVGILLAPIIAVPYYLATFILGARSTRLPLQYWPLLPFAFAAHHVVYYFGILTGIAKGMIRGRRK
jgi:glycosyltransferase involved in cell wall biosynthesis